MSGGKLNEPTTSTQVQLTRDRFERDVVRGDTPPYYLIPENVEGDYKDFILPYNAGRCRVSWNNNEWKFEYL